MDDHIRPGGLQQLLNCVHIAQITIATAGNHDLVWTVSMQLFTDGSAQKARCRVTMIRLPPNCPMMVPFWQAGPARRESVGGDQISLSVVGGSRPSGVHPW